MRASRGFAGRLRLTLASVAALAAVLAVGVGPARAAAPVGQITEFSSGLNPGSHPQGIAAGADGNLWFDDLGSTPAIGRITPSGTVTEFSTGLSTSSFPTSIAPGPDGNLWFTDQDISTPAIGQITPSGTITEFSAGLGSGVPNGITAGPDGNLWFADQGGAIGQITPSGTITEYSAGLNTGSQPLAVTKGADGNLWFADIGSTPAIGRITPSGTITEYSAGLNTGSQPVAITAGPDGNLWFADEGSTPAVGRITPSGTITEFSAGLNTSSFLTSIAPGPDGNLWFTDGGSTPAIGQITPSGTITEYSAGLNVSSYPSGIAAGADGNMWFTDSGGTEAIGRIGTNGSAPIAPSNTSVPTGYGNVSPTVGQQFTGGAGTWSGTQPIDYTYTWLRCPDTTIAHCSTALQSSATTSTTTSYTLQQADVGDRMFLKVTASNSASQASAYTASFSGIIEAAPTPSTPPSNTSVPTVAGSGSPTVGEQFTGSAGSWSGTQPISYTYRWLRCPNLIYQQCSTASQSEPSTSTAASYTLQKADIGDRMRLEVVAANAAGQATADGGFSGVIAPFRGAPVPTPAHPILVPVVRDWPGGTVQTLIATLYNPTPNSTGGTYIVTTSDPTPTPPTPSCIPISPPAGGGTSRSCGFLIQGGGGGFQLAARYGLSSAFAGDAVTLPPVLATPSTAHRHGPRRLVALAGGTVTHLKAGVAYLRTPLTGRTLKALQRRAHHGVVRVKVVTWLVPSPAALHARTPGVKIVQRASTITLRLTRHHAKHHKGR